MDIKEIFDAEPKSVLQILGEPGVGFYIPAYQREYSWKNDNVRRLFEDAIHGLNLLVDNEDSITFIGSLITIHDTKYQTIDPQVKGDMPGRVMLVIDGQQRLTTLLIITTVLYDYIKNTFIKFRGSDISSHQWLYNESQKILPELARIYEIDMSYGDAIFQWYPRIIRAYDDSWSRTKNHAKYSSPIASYLHKFSSYTKEKTDKNTTFSYTEHDMIETNFKHVKKLLSNVRTGGNEDLEIPDLETLLNSETLQTVLFNSEIPEPIVSEIKTVDSHKFFNELFRVIVFSRFIIHRMAVTLVTAKNEDYAFDMFEALNTTGEPLTAIETFKPHVIRAEGIIEYEQSISRGYMNEIERYLSKFSDKASVKQKATSDLLIPFRLFEVGEKLSTRLSDQRKFLKDEFTFDEDINRKRGFLQRLSHTAIFLELVWSSQKIQIPSMDTRDSDLELLCLDFLKKSRHDITVSIFSRYFSAFLLAKEDNKLEAWNDFKEIVKAVTAFYVIWRSSRPTTEAIDSKYRALMQKGVSELNIHSFCCHTKKQADLNSLPSPHKLKNALKYFLTEKNVISKQDWIKKTIANPIYRVATPVARFILYLAAHDSCINPTHPTELISSREGHLAMLNTQAWEKSLTVEHVAPQLNKAEGWDDSLYNEADIIHRIGNLTLLPKQENSSFGSKPWIYKKWLYAALGAPTSHEFEDIIKEAQNTGIELSQSTLELMRKSAYLPYSLSISKYENWDSNSVQKRGENICGLAWDKLSNWLDI